MKPKAEKPFLKKESLGKETKESEIQKVFFKYAFCNQCGYNSKECKYNIMYPIISFNSFEECYKKVFSIQEKEFLELIENIRENQCPSDETDFVLDKIQSAVEGKK